MGLNLSGFYKDKKVFITGHTGFKGSWLAIWLKELGAEISGLSLPPLNRNGNFNLAEVDQKMKSYINDIRDRNMVNEIFGIEQPEIVFHLAAQPLVIEGYKNPIYTFDTNFSGTLNVLEACRNTGSVKQIVIITTDKVYSNQEKVTGYIEEDPLGGTDPYSASKSSAEMVAQSYFKSYFEHLLPDNNQKSLVTVRAGNVIGGGDWSESRIIPDCIRALEENKKIIIRNPNAIRPWQFVLEPLMGYLMLPVRMNSNLGKYSGTWNFGPEEGSISVRELVAKIIDHWGSGSWTEVNANNEYHETETLKLNITKAKEVLGWIPVYNISEAIEKTVYWYKNYKGNNVYRICVDQIQDFTNRWNSQNLK